MRCKGQNVFEMLRRGGAVVKSIHWAGFAAVGASWDRLGARRGRAPGNNGLELTHGRAAPVELGKYVCRAKTLHSLSGRKQTQQTPHLTCALDVLQVCDDARAGAVLNDFAHRSIPIYICSPHHITKQGTLYTLAHGRRLSAHARGQARTRQRLAALRLRRGRVPGHDQAAACYLRRARGRLWRTKPLLSAGDGLLFTAGHERHPDAAHRP